jgi:SAM-dependent methyltransferase
VKGGHDPRTIEFYSQEALLYANHRRPILADRLKIFTGLLPPEGLVLEIGCGGGQDAQAMLGLGLKVAPTDASPEMARQAQTRLGMPVRVMLAEDLAEVAAFDGVWASASLLHIPRDGLMNVLRRIHRALKPSGVFYASYKAGCEEGRDRLGRYYNYPSQSWLLRTYEGAAHWSALTVETSSGGGYDGLAATWLHVIARKA